MHIESHDHTALRSNLRLTKDIEPPTTPPTTWEPPPVWGQPGLHQYIDPTPIAINLCTDDPVFIAITGFHYWVPPSLPSLTGGPHKRLIYHSC